MYDECKSQFLLCDNLLSGHLILVSYQKYIEITKVCVKFVITWTHTCVGLLLVVRVSSQ